jgi:hypothetical protein
MALRKRLDGQDFISYSVSCPARGTIHIASSTIRGTSCSGRLPVGEGDPISPGTRWVARSELDLERVATGPSGSRPACRQAGPPVGLTVSPDHCVPASPAAHQAAGRPKLDRAPGDVAGQARSMRAARSSPEVRRIVREALHLDHERRALFSAGGTRYVGLPRPSLRGDEGPGRRSFDSRRQARRSVGDRSSTTAVRLGQRWSTASATATRFSRSL